MHCICSAKTSIGGDVKFHLDDEGKEGARATASNGAELGHESSATTAVFKGARMLVRIEMEAALNGGEVKNENTVCCTYKLD